MSRGRKGWGQKAWIDNYFLRLMENPLSEPHSMRQLFYKELPEITRLVPSRVQSNPKWGMNFYQKMCEYCSDLYLAGKVSYNKMNIYNDAGASSYIYQDFKDIDFPPLEECETDYPIEIWVENNATFNSLFSMVGWPYRKQPGFIKLNIQSGKGFAKSQDLEKLEIGRLEDVQYILTLNDFDPSGWCMGSHDLQNRLDQLGFKIEVIYIGIKPEQIPVERRSTSLVTYKKSDKRTSAFLKEFGDDPLVKAGYGYEIQALTPSEIRALVRKWIEATIQVVYDTDFSFNMEDN